MPYLLLMLRCLIAATFLVASAGKVSSSGRFREFVASVQDMGVVPRSWTTPVAALVVTLEIGVWALLAVPGRDAGIAGFLLAAALLSAFTAGIALSMRNGARAACRCFGVSNAPLGRRHLARNLLLTAGAVAGGVLIVAGDSARPHPQGAVPAVAAGLVLAAAVATSDEIVALFGASTRPSGSR
ncbi:MauE/DoxX family redox-associated membrane protein [Micromonospora arborensis]|uniref:MauE/DoxX family redox-associated membrane protein n=1 Tax=Micromonospora arborensis TaxID=2116518 RepID=UPI0037117702